MSSNVQRVFAAFIMVGLLLLILHDSRFHFDKGVVAVKQKHYSAQRNWSIFYSQQYVYNNSSIRYQADFKQIKEFIRPNSVLLSDLASSYYAAAQLPVYIRNVHPHHSRTLPYAWKTLFKKSLDAI